MYNGIEKYVTPVYEGDNSKPVKYLSRSKEYYNVKNMTELSEEREKLKEKLDRRITKRNFVILENMLNCSGKVYFKKLEKYIKDRTIQNQRAMEEARSCMEEDVRNILVILSKKGLININRYLRLPLGMENSQKRLIEMDNKAMLYVFGKAIELDNIPGDKEILIPGYGGIYIGPFLREMYGVDYTNLLKSKYIDDANPKSGMFTFDERVNNDRVFEKGKKIVLLDDNIGTGQTMKEIKQELEQYRINDVISGAIQYNWLNYYRISIGEKKNDKYGNKIERFNIEDYDFVSPINYYGHKLCDTAIDMLHSSGEEYISYLKSKSYRMDQYNDIVGTIERGMQYAEMSGLNLSEKYNYKKRKEREVKPLTEEYKNKNENEKLTVKGQASLDKIIENVKIIIEDKTTLFEKEK